jgi:putative phosphotransacetylase
VKNMDKLIPVGISGRHLHVSQEDLETLFGAGYQLTTMKDLAQPGQFAAKETVELATEKGSIKNVRILGPVRKQTQIEVALTDAIKLGITPPVRDSGDLKNSPGLTIKGPSGQVTLKEGAICAARHIHMTPAEAAGFNLKDKEFVSIKVEGERAAILQNVLVRVHETFQLELHVDTDEGNAVKLKTGDKVAIVK